MPVSSWSSSWPPAASRPSGTSPPSCTSSPGDGHERLRPRYAARCGHGRLRPRYAARCGHGRMRPRYAARCMTVPDAAWIAPRYGTASLADLLPSALAALAPASGGPDALGFGASLDGIRKVGVLLVD